MIPSKDNTQEVNREMVENYLDKLVNKLFKILPIKEDSEKTLGTYLISLQSELLGCKGLISFLDNDADYLSILSVIQYFIDTPEAPVKEVRREVFRTISLCNALRERYAWGDSNVSD